MIARPGCALLLAVLLALTAGCGLERLITGEAPGGAPAAAAGDCAPVVLPGEVFEVPAELAITEYPEASTPAEAPLVRLDLSAGRVHTYLSDMTLDASNPLGPKESPMTRRETLVFKGEGEGRGRFLMYAEPPPGSPDAGKGEQLFGHVGDVREDTSIRGHVSQELDLQMRFPLPPAALAPGVAIARPVRYPLDVFGAYLFARGTMTFLLDRYVTVDGHRAVQYKVKLEVRDVDRVSEVKRPPEVDIVLHAVAVFDLDDRSFVAVKSHMKSRVDLSPGPAPGMPAEIADAGAATAEARRTIVRDRARTTPAKDPAAPVPAFDCQVAFTPGQTFEVPSELVPAGLSDAPAPAAAPQIRWNFAEPGKVYGYAVTEVDPTPNPLREGSTETVTLRTVLLRSQGKGAAHFVTYEVTEGVGAPGETLSDLMPVVIVDVAADTTIDGRLSQEAELRLRFPVPPAPLEPGRPIATPFAIPFNLDGVMFHGRGTMTFLFDRYVTADGHLAVQYRVKTEVRSAQAPPEAEGSPEIAFEHLAVAVFDVEEGSFVVVKSQEKKRVDIVGAMGRAAKDLPADVGVSESSARLTITRDPGRVTDPMPRR